MVMILNGFERPAIEFHNKRNFKGYPPLKFHVQEGGDIQIYIVDSRWKAGPKNAHNDLCALRYPPPCAFTKGAPMPSGTYNHDVKQNMP